MALVQGMFKQVTLPMNSSLLDIDLRKASDWCLHFRATQPADQVTDSFRILAFAVNFANTS